jgi:hypothetical protein
VDLYTFLVIAMLSIVALGTLVLGGMNLYQAVTGKRLSKKPSTRSDAVMRRQSAIAAPVMFACTALVTATLGLVLTIS